MPNSESPFDADSTREFLVRPVQRYAIRTAMLVALGVYASYLVYRGLYTLNPDAPGFSLAVYAAEIHGFISLALYFHQVWALRRRRVVEPPDGLKVDVFITTYNEDVDLLRQTVRAAAAMRYPHRTFVLDDGRRAEVKALAEELGCTYLTRADNAHAKAGNWNNAFRHSDGDVIATFDADHVPRPDFLERTLGYFRDPRVALVQVPQQYHNLDSVQHRVSWRSRRMYSEQDAFFGLVMPGKDGWNAAFFCGTGAVLRREALEPYGGIKTDTITEDLHTSLELHAAGWKSVYLNEVLVTGLAPMDLRTFETQRLRWAEGNLRVASFINPLTARGLSLHQRISYFSSLFHWTVGLPKLVFYLAPPWILFTGTFPIANYDADFLKLYLAFLSTLIGSYYLASYGKGRLLLDELFNMVSFFTLIRAVKRVVVGRSRPPRFVVTAKRGRGGRDARPILPHAALVSFSLLAMVWSALGMGFGITDDLFGAGTAMFWTFYNLSLLLIVVRLGLRPAEKRVASRFRANFPVEIRGQAAMGVTMDLSEGGCSLGWPEPLPVGQELPLRLHFAGRTAEWAAHIVSDQGRTGKGWHRYGIRFSNLTQADIDLINDSVFSLVVPDLFDGLQPASWLTLRLQRFVRWLSGRSRARAPRRPSTIPVRVQHAAGSFVSVTRDVSETGLSLASPSPVPLGSTLHLVLNVPGRPLHCEVSVVRCTHRPSRPGFDRWVLGLRFEAIGDGSEVAGIQQLEAA